MIDLFQTVNLVTFDGERFHVSIPYGDHALREKLKDILGAKWHAKEKEWTVPGASEQLDQLLLIDGLDWTPQAQGAVHGIRIREQELFELSGSTGIDLSLPGFGMPPFPFQNAGIEYVIRQERVLIADEPGLGKTIQELGALFATFAFPCLIICPPSLKYMWLETVKKAIPGKTAIVAGKDTPALEIMMADVVITNYQQLVGFRTYQDDEGKKRRTSFVDATKREAIPSKLAEVLQQMQLKMIAIDEAHAIKDPKTAQTMVIMELRHGVKYRVLLTGTPAPNRSAELVSYLKFLDWLDFFGGWYHFMQYYCGFKRGRFGMEAKESMHTMELHNKLRRLCYVRRKKKDVAKDLPEKTRATYAVDIDNRKEYEFAEEQIVEWAAAQVRKNQAFLDSIAHLDRNSQERAIQMEEYNKALAAERNEAIVRFNALKRIAARGKLAAAMEWIDNFLETEEKLVVFAMHRDIIDALLKKYKGCARIISDDDDMERQRNVKRFQEDDSCRIIIAAMGMHLGSSPGGVGHTLTAASNTFHLELGWNAAHMDQLEDRCHRIGAKNACTAHYMLGIQTVEIDIGDMIEDKRKMAAQVVDGEEAPAEAPIVDDLIRKFAGKKK